VHTGKFLPGVTALVLSENSLKSSVTLLRASAPPSLIFTKKLIQRSLRSSASALVRQRWRSFLSRGLSRRVSGTAPAEAIAAEKRTREATIRAEQLLPTKEGFGGAFFERRSWRMRELQRIRGGWATINKCTTRAATILVRKRR